jgi:hypothetical protein
MGLFAQIPTGYPPALRGNLKIVSDLEPEVLTLAKEFVMAGQAKRDPAMTT